MDNNARENVGVNASAPLQVPPTSKDKKNVGLVVATVVFAILAIVGVTFGVYGMMDSNKKDQQISDLRADLEDKDAQITNLETEISNLDSKTENVIIDPDDLVSDGMASEVESGATASDGTAKIMLGEELDQNETRTAFKIGDCTADGPSVKCPVDADGKQALISYNGNDSILRLILPND